MKKETKLKLFVEKKEGISQKEKPYKFYELSTEIMGINVKLAVSDYTAKLLVESYIENFESLERRELNK